MGWLGQNRLQSPHQLESVLIDKDHRNRMKNRGQSLFMHRSKRRWLESVWCKEEPRGLPNETPIACDDLVSPSYDALFSLFPVCLQHRQESLNTPDI